MKAIVLLLALVGIVSAQVYARAELQQVNGSGANGYVIFSQTAAGENVTVHAYVQNISENPDALHGIHVHWWGDMTGVNAGALTVGGHWNPFNAPHGCPGNTTRHAGDMGNWQAVGGVINQTKTLDLLELSGINSIVGRAVIFHNLTDDCVTPNTGNAGSRMATGVIGIVNSTVYGGSGEANNSIGGVTVAGCKLQPASGTNVSGMVYFVQTGGAGSTTVMAMVDGITGSHGFHLHWFGDISSPTGLATGGHFNPLGQLHGIPPVLQRHLGDMGIISYAANGSSLYYYVNDQISLNGINNVIGRAVHVHMNSDDCSNPVGSGGARWAQCTIGIFNATAFTAPTNFGSVPTTQNGIAICNVAYNASSTSTSNSGSMSSTVSGSGSVSGSSTAANSDAIRASYVVACILAAIVALFL